MYRRPFILAGIAGMSVFSSLSLAQSMSSTAAEKRMLYSQRPEVKKFIKDVSARRGLDEEWVAAVLDQATYQPKIERLMTPKPAPKNTKDSRKDWEKYRNIFLGQHRLNLGMKFWQDNKQYLDKAQEIYHVDPAVIIGIIGVETRYGENTGSWKVLDSLVTLSFDYKRRADFFKKELEEFLVILHKNDLKPFEVEGSYAGAVGLPQFMPSSIKRFGVDFDGDGKIDINHSTADTIGSIANYLSKHGWVEGLPMVIEADITDEQAAKFGGGTNPRFKWSSLLKSGVKPLDKSTHYPADMPVFIVDFPYYIPGSLDYTKLYRIGTKNFTSVLRYNSSYFYAGAVLELGTAIAELMGYPGLIDGEKLLPPHLKPAASPNPSDGIKETVTPLNPPKAAG
ncbi:lytic murein transglycosylase B [uncultured Parasutterella sp.]|uniref:lytic murein transglycosylase B n=1 Tax=uncultured Parasutterella sp. TaxID=1263098 RepID=UPI002599FBF7|nr:lytic murein transglycosylase B [uncultured Parasutterella sp.]